MDAQTIVLLIAGGGALGVMVWVLAKLGKALIIIAEALAAAAVVFLAVWLLIKAVIWALRQMVTHWRTSVTLVALWAWWHWCVAGHHRRCGRRGPHRMATGQREVIRCLGGALPALVVAALGDLRPEAA